MRFQLVARRIVLAPALGLALAAAVAACSSASSSSSSSTGATTAPASSASASSASAPASSNNSAAVAQITTNWEKFFDANTPVSQKIPLLQNGSTFASAISAMSQLPLASGIGAKVTSVTVTSPTSANVTYNIVAGGTPLQSGEKGKAVLQAGVWKVSDASLCGLFHLVPGGTIPSACNSVS